MKSVADAASGGDVEDFAADPGAATGQGGDGPGEPVEVAAREVDGVRGSQALGRPLDQGPAQNLGGAGDQSDLQTAVTALT